MFLIGTGSSSPYRERPKLPLAPSEPMKNAAENARYVGTFCEEGLV